MSWVHAIDSSPTAFLFTFTTVSSLVFESAVQCNRQYTLCWT